MMRGEELLIQYIESGLNREERFELEKLALDDPFLADAYEGITGPDSQQASLIIDRIRKNLNEQKGKEKVVPMYRKLWPYAVAASLIFVASVGILLRPASDVASFAQETSMEIYDEATIAEAIETQDVEDDLESVVETVVAQDVINESFNAKEDIPQVVALQLEKESTSDLTNEPSTQNGITLTIDNLDNRKIKKEILSAPRATNKEISLRRRAPVEKSSSDLSAGQVLSVETSTLEKGAIPNAKATSKDPIPNGLTDAKLQALPQGEKPVPIPNEMDLVDFDSSRKQRVLKSLELLKEEALEVSLSDESNIPNTSILKKGKFDFQSAQNFELDSNENIVLPGNQLTLADGMTAYLHSSPVLGESVIINTSPQTSDKAFTAYALMVATLDEDSNENCATTKAKYRSEYKEKPDLALAHDLYNLLKARGCPRDGSDAFMVELKNDYEAWTAE